MTPHASNIYMEQKLLSFDASAQEWIDAGLATAKKGLGSVDLRKLTFDAAQAKALVHLSAAGAMALDREARRHEQGKN